jgi:hypothetical protein
VDYHSLHNRPIKIPGYNKRTLIKILSGFSGSNVHKRYPGSIFKPGRIMRKKEFMLLRHKILSSGCIYRNNVDNPDTVSKHHQELCMNIFKVLLPAIAVSLAVSGCYTQFAMVNQTTPQPKEQVYYEVDSTTGDTVKVVKQVDTVRTREHQTCIWERDLMGYPRLYCYDSFYPSNWWYYNNNPWWYDYPYYSGGYSYYGNRRHYQHYYEYEDRGNGSTSQEEPSGATGSSYRARTRGIPGQEAQPSGGNSSATPAAGSQKSAAISNSTQPAQGTILIPSSNEQKPVLINQRNAGVPDRGTPAPAPVPSSGYTASVPGSPPPSSGSSVAPPPPPPPAKQSSSPSQSSGHQRRNARSW